MIHKKETFPFTDLPRFQQHYLTMDMLFFDIETTGLNPSRDQIYCIGCGYLSSTDVSVELFFAEDPPDEKHVLAAFLQLLAKHKTVITFNGNTFDIPFVKKRAAQHRIPVLFSHVSSIDLYREASGMKALLRLPSYRQKSLEAFLGCSRDDRFDGSQLIEIYQKYTTSQDSDLLSILLLHNFEDVKGMFDLFGLLSYRQLSGGQFKITDMFRESSRTKTDSIRNSDTNLPDKTNRIYNIKLRPEFPLPASIRLISEGSAIFLNCEEGLVRFPLYYGIIKYFFEDYENYYYLPDEDCAIHKSVGIFVDPAHRKKATARTCYAKKECEYLSFPENQGNTPLRKEYQDKNRYLTLPAEADELHAFLCLYFSSIL